MSLNSAYTNLLAHARETAALGQIGGLLSWDQEVMMPANGTEQRAEQAGALEAVLHARRTDPRIGDWLAAVDVTALDPVGKANLREIRRSFERARCVPAELATELARLTARSQRVWAQAREEEDVAAFLPSLERIVTLTRERAACLADGGPLYDALLADYEPGTGADALAQTFARLRTGLAELRGRILDRPAPARLQGSFDPEGQMALARTLAGALGYDWSSGRLDLTTHPFMAGTRGDARLTTRIDAADPFNCLYSTVHETGHALYEQGLDPDLAWQPAGNSVSMGVHESQSRLCENQIGRSAGYAEYLYPLMRDRFGEFGLAGPQDLYRAANRVAPGFIRTEADEVHYNLHIMMRFDLERALVAGDLPVADLEAAWNDRFAADFGTAVDRPSNGLLQDVHWSVGLIGYFPTYTLGNIYAGCLWAAIRASLGGLDAMIRAGDVTPIIDWLRTKIHRRGSILMPRELIEEATGAEPTEAPLLAYLQDKFGQLYGL